MTKVSQLWDTREVWNNIPDLGTVHVLGELLGDFLGNDDTPLLASRDTLALCALLAFDMSR